MRQRTIFATSAVVTVMLAGACGTGGSQQAGDDSGSSSSASSSAPPASASPTKEPSTSPPSSTKRPEHSKKPTDGQQGRIATKCDVEHVRPSFHRGDSAAGSRHAWLVLTNTSQTTCTVYGYGGMQLYDDDGRKVPTKLVRDRGTTPSTLSVRPGASVRSLLTWSAVPHEGDRSSGTCQREASIARVTPPDETHTLGAKWSLGPVCDSGTIQQQPFRGKRLEPGR